MGEIIYSEALKLKKSGTISMSLAIPFAALFLAFLMGGMQIFATFSIYWWEAIFLYLLIGLLFLYDKKMEENAGNFQNIYQKQLAWKIHLAKILLILSSILIATLAFIILLYLVSWIYQGILVVNFLKVSIALFFILFAVAWNLPFLYILSKHFNAYVLLATNTLICLLVAPLLAQTRFWFLFPYTYHYKVAEFVLNINPAGDVNAGQTSFNFLEVLLPVVLSTLLTIVFLYLLKGVLSHVKK